MKREDQLTGFLIGAAAVYIFARPTFDSILQQIKDLLNFSAGEKPPATVNIPISISDPSALEKWSPLLPHTVDAQATNPSATDYKIYFGMSITGPQEQIIKNFYYYPFTLKAGETKKIGWTILPYGIPARGVMNVIIKAWDDVPSVNANELGVQGVTFNYD